MEGKDGAGRVQREVRTGLRRRPVRSDGGGLECQLGNVKALTSSVLDDVDCHSSAFVSGSSEWLCGRRKPKAPGGQVGAKPVHLGRPGGLGIHPRSGCRREN